MIKDWRLEYLSSGTWTQRHQSACQKIKTLLPEWSYVLWNNNMHGVSMKQSVRMINSVWTLASEILVIQSKVWRQNKWMGRISWICQIHQLLPSPISPRHRINPMERKSPQSQCSKCHRMTVLPGNSGQITLVKISNANAAKLVHLI